MIMKNVAFDAKVYFLLTRQWIYNEYIDAVILIKTFSIEANLVSDIIKFEITIEVILPYKNRYNYVYISILGIHLPLSENCFNS